MIKQLKLSDDYIIDIKVQVRSKWYVFNNIYWKNQKWYKCILKRNAY